MNRATEPTEAPGCCLAVDGAPLAPDRMAGERLIDEPLRTIALAVADDVLLALGDAARGYGTYPNGGVHGDDR